MPHQGDPTEEFVKLVQEKTGETPEQIRDRYRKRYESVRDTLAARRATPGLPLSAATSDSIFRGLGFPENPVQLTEEHPGGGGAFNVRDEPFSYFGPREIRINPTDVAMNALVGQPDSVLANKEERRRLADERLSEVLTHETAHGATVDPRGQTIPGTLQGFTVRFLDEFDSLDEETQRKHYAAYGHDEYTGSRRQRQEILAKTLERGFGLARRADPDNPQRLAEEVRQANDEFPGTRMAYNFWIRRFMEGGDLEGQPLPHEAGTGQPLGAGPEGPRRFTEPADAIQAELPIGPLGRRTGEPFTGLIEPEEEQQAQPNLAELEAISQGVQQDVVRVRDTQLRRPPLQSIGPSTAPLTEEIEPDLPGRLTTSVAALARGLRESPSFTGAAAQFAQRDLPNIVRRAVGGAEISDEDFERIDRWMERAAGQFPVTATTAEFFGLMGGIISDLTALKAGAAAGALRTTGRTSKALESLGRWNQPTRGQTALVNLSEEAALQVGYTAREGVDPEAIATGVAASIILPVALPFRQMTEKVGAMAQRELRVTGALPSTGARRGDPAEFAAEASDVFWNKFRQDSWVRGQTNEALQLAREFDRSVKDMVKAGHFNTADEAEQVVNLALQARGPGPLAQVPPEMRPIVSAMRDKIDVLSQRMIDDGLVQGDMIPVFENNFGIYLNRTYFKYEDPSWALETVDPRIVNRARNFIRHQPAYQGLSTDQLDEVLRRLLWEPDDAPARVAARRGVGAKNLDVMRRRTLDSPEIRELFGEVHNAKQNFVRSVMKMSHLIGSHNFLTEAREVGLGSGWLSHADDVVPGHTAQIAAEASDVLSPLNGLHTTPEIYRAFQEAVRDPIIHQWPQSVMKAMAATKHGKVVLSPQTHVRNFTSAFSFSLANGHLSLWPRTFRDLKTAMRTIEADIGRKIPSFRQKRGIPERVEDPIQKLLDGDLDLSDVGQMQGFANRMREIGVIGTSARAGEIHDIFRATLRNEDAFHYMEQYAKGPVRSIVRGVEAAYGAEDDFHKIMGAINEYRRYRQAIPVEEMSNATLESFVGRLVSDTYPTYPLAPRAVRRLAMFPLIAPFATFSAESVRTGYNILKQTAFEIKHQNPKIRQIGYQRAMGILLTGGSTVAAAAVGREMVGIGRETDRDFREALPPWSENSQIMWLDWDREAGTVSYIDLSYQDPYNYLRKPLLALMANEDWESRFVEAARELGDPFVSPDIFAEAVGQVIRNEDQNGDMIRNPTEPRSKQIKDGVTQFIRTVEPGFITQGRRVSQAFDAPWVRSDDRNRRLSGPVEIGAVVGGVRVSKIDFNSMLFFRGRDLADEIRLMAQTANEAIRTTREVSLDDVREAYLLSEESRRKAFDRFQQVIKTARVAGLTDIQIRRQLNAARLGQDFVRDLMRNRYRPARRDVPRGVPNYSERRRLLRQLERDLRFPSGGIEQGPVP